MSRIALFRERIEQAAKARLAEFDNSIYFHHDLMTESTFKGGFSYGAMWATCEFIDAIEEAELSERDRATFHAIIENAITRH